MAVLFFIFLGPPHAYPKKLVYIQQQQTPPTAAADRQREMRNPQTSIVASGSPIGNCAKAALAIFPATTTTGKVPRSTFNLMCRSIRPCQADSIFGIRRSDTDGIGPMKLFFFYIFFSHGRLTFFLIILLFLAFTVSRHLI